MSPRPTKSMTPRAIKRRANDLRKNQPGSHRGSYRTTTGKGGQQPTGHEKRGGSSVAKPADYTIGMSRGSNAWCFVCDSPHRWDVACPAVHPARRSSKHAVSK